MKLEGGGNDLLDRIAADDRFPMNRSELESLLDVHKFTGCAKEQTETFLAEFVRPVLRSTRTSWGRKCPSTCNNESRVRRARRIGMEERSC